MRIVSEFPAKTRVIENTWIPMSDGCRLAARIILPEDANTNSVPAILEYIPYRKRDYTAVQDAAVHQYFAGHGYACVRVDMRGSGDSDGILMDEYLPQEQEDGVEVIAWIAAQPWCDGAVGMMGYSWGGITSMQIASRRPPALKAIIPVTSSVDRYYDDGSYFVGCYSGQTVGWGVEMDAFNGRPPDPEIVGERWRNMWLERLEKTPFFLEIWLRHQRRDAYWLQGTICENYDAIQCPVMAFGGWADCWPNTVSRLLTNLKVPRKGVSGPWGHNYPCFAMPGPQIGFLQEALRWWDFWLKGNDTGIQDEPAFRGFMLHSVEPRTFYKERPGHWIAEPDWPPPSVSERRLFLNPGTVVGRGRRRSYPVVPLTADLRPRLGRVYALVRRRSGCRAAPRSARGRRQVAPVRYCTARRSPSNLGQPEVVASYRVGLLRRPDRGQALRRGAGWCLHTDMFRHPQSRAARRPRGAFSGRARRLLRCHRAAQRRGPMSSHPGTVCGSPCRPAIGRWLGRCPSRPP